MAAETMASSCTQAFLPVKNTSSRSSLASLWNPVKSAGAAGILQQRSSSSASAAGSQRKSDGSGAHPVVGAVVDAQRDAADADATYGGRAALEEAGGGVPGAPFVADVMELDVEARDRLPAAVPRWREHGRADHVEGGQAGEDLV